MKFLPRIRPQGVSSLVHTAARIPAMISAVLFCASAVPASASNLCGTVNGSLAASGSPYTVTCNLEIEVGESLDIDPGVVLSFDPGTHMTVDGTLTAIGTPGSRILLTSSAPAPNRGDWDGIWVNRTADLQHVKIEYSDDGVIFSTDS